MTNIMSKRARRLRRHKTDAEKKLWRQLRKLNRQGYHFRQQAPIGPYIADFAEHNEKLVIEVDGGQHGEEPGLKADARRSTWLNSQGYQVLRFWNGIVLTNVEGVITEIMIALGMLDRIGTSSASHESSPSALMEEGRGGGETQALQSPPTPNPSPPGGGGFPAAWEGAQPFTDTHDLWSRAGVPVASLEKLAAADAFRSMGLDRRQALWEVRALINAGPLPLFNWSDTREAGREEKTALPQMPLSEHVINDYQTLRLSLKAHPMSFLRDDLAARRVSACTDLRKMKDGAFVSVAGLVLVRQRPGTAKGVVFMTIEDETGIANAVIWAKTLEKFRKQVMGARLIIVHGRVQRHEDIIHIVAAKLEDRSEMLSRLSEAAQEMNAQPAGRHPRDQRIIPKSRDFH